ncbi:alpha/beta fold hydrolase [Nonlabens antarcticus]|uniref:alpha/beta fold hydrolase n=1 Tax=Nonlabens antarcticus TaxID=392714 RepID=UPI001891144C|nr:alpha/beta hydrolase [Nonlabens antarcticus]
MKHVYLMPGMAASPLIFEYIELPKDRFEIHLMDWINPEKKESLPDYCTRLLEQIKHVNPVLIGVSFGGIIVQEISKLIAVEKVIIISSVKCVAEFPRRMRICRKTQLHRLLPTRLMENFEGISKYAVGVAPKKIELYQKYIHMNNRVYLDWALDSVMNWSQEEPLDYVIHIHGEKDPIFPIKYIKNCIIVPGGTHVMIINRFRWFNENLPEIIDGK